MTVNVANIDKTIARIRQNKNFKFNMGSWGASQDNQQKDADGHFCGTSACIAGFAMIADNKFLIVQKEITVFNKDDTSQRIKVDVLDIPMDEDNQFYVKHGIEVLGITEAQGVALFLPFQDYVYVSDEEASDTIKQGFHDGPFFMRATEDQAIAVLEHLKATGDVDWSVSGIKGDDTFYDAWKMTKGTDFSVLVKGE